MSRYPTLCIDFDGVVNRYSRGWQDGVLYDDAVPGFFQWAEKAMRKLSLVIYSSRSKSPEGIAAMRTWMYGQAKQAEGIWPNSIERNGFLDTLKYAASKPAAFLTIDDRAICFTGDWSAPELKAEQLLAFEPWNQKPALVNDNPFTETEYESKHVVTVVSGEDEWEGVYVDGVLLEQGHSGIAGSALKAVVQAPGATVENITIPADYMEELGHLPERLADLPAEMRRAA